jgi:hypothetical protein
VRIGANDGIEVGKEIFPQNVLAGAPVIYVWNERFALYSVRHLSLSLYINIAVIKIENCPAYLQILKVVPQAVMICQFATQNIFSEQAENGSKA